MCDARSVPYLLQSKRYALPFRAPVRTAHGLWPVREGLLVRLEDEAGVVGYGEAAPIPGFGRETAEDDESALRTLGDRAEAAQLAAVPDWLGSLRQALAAAMRREAPVPRRKHLGVAALLPAGRPAVALVAPKAEAGFRVFKWKVGVGDIADELGLLDELCAELPAGAKLRLDANGAWDRRSAERWLDRCAERPVEFVEQPCFAPGAPGTAGRSQLENLLLGLATDHPTPLALDESLAGDGDIARWLDLGWPGVYVIKPALLGDGAALLARLAAAKAAVVFSTALETAVGAQAGLRVAFEWPGEPRALGFGVWPVFADGRYDGPPAAPFLHWEDVERIDPEAVWNALN